LWLQVSVPKEKNVLDFVESFSTSMMKSCKFLAARTFFTIATSFVHPQDIFLAKLQVMENIP
jgi:hypothetical protein